MRLTANEICFSFHFDYSVTFHRSKESIQVIIYGQIVSVRRWKHQILLWFIPFLHSQTSIFSFCIRIASSVCCMEFHVSITSPRRMGKFMGLLIHWSISDVAFRQQHHPLRQRWLHFERRIRIVRRCTVWLGKSTNGGFHHISGIETSQHF